MGFCQGFTVSAFQSWNDWSDTRVGSQLLSAPLTDEGPFTVPGSPESPLGLDNSPESRAANVRHAADLLCQKGFSYIGEDPVGLPCYRSPSGTLLVSIGSCRSLAYVQVNGKAQLVAAARTSTLACRITLPDVN
jgi:hypothetical protein